MSTKKKYLVDEELLSATGRKPHELQQTKTDGQVQTKVTSAFDNILYKNISPLDVSHIRNVYERVWLATVLKEEAENKRTGK